MNNNMPSMMHCNVPYQSALIHNKPVPMIEPGTQMMFQNQYIPNGNSQMHDRENGLPICTMTPNQQGIMMHNSNGHNGQNRNRPMIPNSYGPMGPNPNMYIGQVPNGHMGPTAQAVMVQNHQGSINPNIPCQIATNQHGAISLHPHGVMSQVGSDIVLANFNQARSTTQYPFTECRINEFNRRLQERTEACDNEWWNALITDFFEDDAILNITFADDRPHKFCLCRAMIPRYFRRIFDSGCSEYFFFMRSVRNYCHGSSIITDSDSALSQMSFPKCSPSQSVTVEGRLVLVLNNNELMRIKSWTFDIRNNREYILKTLAWTNDTNSNTIDPITHCGIPISLLRFLRITNALQQSFRQKPKLIWKPMTAPTESTRKTYKRKKLKDSNSNLAVKPKKSPSLFLMNSRQSSEVIVTSDPILVGSEYAEAEERTITKFEHIQYDNLVSDKMLNKSSNTRKSIPAKLIKSGSVNSSSNSQHSITCPDQMPHFNSNTPDTKNSDLSPITNLSEN